MLGIHCVWLLYQVGGCRRSVRCRYSCSHGCSILVTIPLLLMKDCGKKHQEKGKAKEGACKSIIHGGGDAFWWWFSVAVPSK